MNQNNISVTDKIRDIRLDISWRELSRKYFDKPAAWLYERLDGVDENGNPCAFTPEETQLLKGALCDLANRIRECSDSI